MTLKVGLTGGIGCGKSAVTRLFQQKGVPVVDADQIARQVVQPGEMAWQRIAETFGEHALQEDGQLDRNYLRQSVFADQDKKQLLEAIMHPVIREEILKAIENTENAAYVIADIPLLVEKAYQPLFDEIIVVDCSGEQQRTRTQQRDGIADEEIERIISSQASREERLQSATRIVDNTGALEALDEQVNHLHRLFTQPPE